jgi:hypothetical protein
MPLTQAERMQVAEAFLKCFGEDSALTGRTLKFISQFTAGQTNLLAAVQQRALTWQPFIDAGLTQPAWNDDVARNFDLTQTD